MIPRRIRLSKVEQVRQTRHAACDLSVAVWRRGVSSHIGRDEHRDEHR
eukprot:CAMPEP_0181228270 /NCGR_PEP_ID=MMETSP1096-20121128/33260_1 /TAXON_ID=156174 ORGANISM="Chrysochromulina ericina, Strain CCMP281" /NCGR_SAMPLE_ID=MMETSP1096 /ASSEMBLY_ACC=CAM_ASM_000453 /LENGTH=47 /DNA_ID= /DNA_START= /DNA_END= /DNA_ORIENTATION=